MQDFLKTNEGTAAGLVAAAMKLFGQKGYAATSTREIAAAAGTNVASIAYHFGSKDGLRRACGEEVARQIGGALQAVPDEPPASPTEARQRLEATLRAMAVFVLTSRAAEPILPFMLREVNEEGPVLDAVYGAMVEPMHRRLCVLWATATGQDAESERSRLIVFTLIGQLLYFRIARPIVTRRMEWTRFEQREASTIADLLAANLQSLIERERTV